jgi:sugar phosphate isomerase/epimerase
MNGTKSISAMMPYTITISVDGQVKKLYRQAIMCSRILKITLLIFLLHLNKSATAQKIDFFVFNNGIRSVDYDTPEKQAALLKSLGFDGMEKEGLDGIDELIAGLNSSALHLYTIYVNINIDSGLAIYDQRLPQVLKKINDSKTMVAINITSNNKTYHTYPDSGDSLVIAAVRQLADMAGATHTKIVLYPHMWFWLDDFITGVSLVKKIDRQNVGIIFNLPHFLAKATTRQQNHLYAVLKTAQPHLFAVSICGATPISGPQKKNTETGNIWDRLIQPLGEGTFDNKKLLRYLKRLDFSGPVGLQCYNIKDNPKDNLSKAITWWKLR